MNPYSYNSNIIFNFHPATVTKHYTMLTVKTKSSNSEDAIKQASEFGEYYRPSGINKYPLIILAHGIGDKGDGLCRMIAKDLVKRGIACFLVFQLFHPRRMAPNLKPRFPNIEPDEWFELYKACVIEIRQIVDWASSSSDVLNEQIAILGISLGGVISAITMGVESRIKAGIFAVTGGNFESREWLKRAGNNFSEDEYSKVKATYYNYLKEISENGFENIEPAKKSYLYDPVTFAHKLKGRHLLMINAMWDEIFPKQSTLDLWKACNEPPIVWLPGTHATVWLLYPIMRKQIARFLRSEFPK